MAPSPLLDALRRPLQTLRVSVTDRCNLRCAYCMPEHRYDWVPSPELLTFEEITRVVAAFATLGVRKVRLTGGEPLLRRDLPLLIEQLSRAVPAVELALTTNGTRLRELAGALRDAGLQQLTVSLDTLDAQRFAALSRRAQHAAVLEGIDAAREVGFAAPKLDTVVLRGVNDDEVVPLLRFAAERGAEVRFIEYMDVGGATGWARAKVVSRADLLRAIEAELGVVRPVGERGHAPAERFMLGTGQVFGIIASTTQPFCGACDRARLSAEGQLLTCLYATSGVDLRALVRSGGSDELLREAIASRWLARNDKGAEQRAALEQARGPWKSADELRKAPGLEMHRRGG
ncbi:MAG: GTP 3',8-cyclase MoaA [Myxococcaceae bacterium]